MPSKKTKQAAKAAAHTLPFNPITLTFTSEVKKQALQNNTEVSYIDSEGKEVFVSARQLPRVITTTYTITGRLLGFEHNEDFKQLMDFKGASLYNCTSCIAVSVSGTPVRTSLRILTNKTSLKNFMLNNACKLFLSEDADFTDDMVQDANYSEIIGRYQHTDVTRVFVGKFITKSMKEDIKIVRNGNAYLQSKVYTSSSPLRRLSSSMVELIGPNELNNFVEHKKLSAKKKNAQIGYGI